MSAKEKDLQRQLTSLEKSANTFDQQLGLIASKKAVVEEQVANLE